jgi:hypothetical protein
MRCRRSNAVATRVLVAWVMLLAPPMAALGQGREVHGENSSFVGHGVAMAWGILRGSSEQDTQVVLRIVPTGAEYAAVSLDGVDPFTQRRQELLGKQPLGRSVDIRTSRGTFADLPRREIHFHPADGQHAQRPSLTVYFAGLPDTTPEFASEAALQNYLEETLAKLLAGKGQTP